MESTYQNHTIEESWLSLSKQIPKVNSSSANNRIFLPTSPFPSAGTSSGLSLHRSYACCHNCYEFICVTVCLYPENTISLKSAVTSDSQSCLVPSFLKIPGPWGERCDLDVLRKTSFPRFLFSVLTAIAHFSWVIFLVFYFLSCLYILDSIPLSLPFYRLPLCLTDSFLCFTKVSLFHKVSVVNC